MSTDTARPPAFSFSPGDWLRNTALRSCSLAARGLWVDLLCFMHGGTPYGQLAVAERDAIPEGQLAQMVGLSACQFRELLAELEHAGVFARTPEGVIYSGRMVRDEQLRQARAAGQKGRPKRASGRAKEIHEGQEELGNGGAFPVLAVACADKNPSALVGVGRQKDKYTWLTPYYDVWVSAYGGKPSVGPMVKHLKALQDEHGAEKTLARWRNYLASTEARFNPTAAKFAATFGTWAAARSNGRREPLDDATPAYDAEGRPAPWLTAEAERVYGK